MPGPFSLFSQGLADFSVCSRGSLFREGREDGEIINSREIHFTFPSPSPFRSFVFSPLASPFPSILFPFYSGRVSSSCHHLPLKKKGPPAVPATVVFFFCLPLSLHCHRLGRLRRLGTCRLLQLVATAVIGVGLTKHFCRLRHFLLFILTSSPFFPSIASRLVYSPLLLYLPLLLLPLVPSPPLSPLHLQLHTYISLNVTLLVLSSCLLFILSCSSSPELGRSRLSLRQSIPSTDASRFASCRVDTTSTVIHCSRRRSAPSNVPPAST